jgi:hypothetical protein
LAYPKYATFAMRLKIQSSPLPGTTLEEDPSPNKTEKNP